MRATGSRLSRRAASARYGVDFARLQDAVAVARSSCGAVEPQARGRAAARASTSATSMPAGLNACAIRRDACATAGAGFQAGDQSSRRAFGRQQFGLVLGHQRVDDLVQRLAFHHLRQLVQRQIDAVIGDAALRKIIGADAFGAVAGADLPAPLGGALGVELAALRRRRAWRAASSSPWPCSCAASAPPARTRRCRSANA